MQKLNLHYIFNVPQVPVAVTYKFPQHSYPEHSHDVDEIVIVTSGRGIHMLNGKIFEAQRGDVFYVRAGDWHLFENVDNLHLFNILCCCTDRPVKTSLPSYEYLQNPPEHWLLQQSILENIEKMVPQLDAECHTVDDATPRMISTLFTQVLTYLWRGRQLIGTDGKRSAGKQMIVRIMNDLNTCYADVHSLECLAQRYALSERSLNRHFKEHTGLSPMHYLIQLRLYKAIELLRTGKALVTETAFRCGFNDSNYFSYCFKNNFGISPSDFHKKCRVFQ